MTNTAHSMRHLAAAAAIGAAAATAAGRVVVARRISLQLWWLPIARPTANASATSTASDIAVRTVRTIRTRTVATTRAAILLQLTPRRESRIRSRHRRLQRLASDRVIDPRAAAAAAAAAQHCRPLQHLQPTVVALLRIDGAALERNRIVVLVCLTRQYDVVRIAETVQIQRIYAQRNRLLDGREQLLRLAYGIVQIVLATADGAAAVAAHTQMHPMLVLLIVLMGGRRRCHRCRDRCHHPMVGIVRLAERETLHVDFGQIGVDVFRQILVVRQFADAVVRGGQRRQDRLVLDAIAIAGQTQSKLITPPNSRCQPNSPVVQKPLIVGIVVREIMR